MLDFVSRRGPAIWVPSEGFESAAAAPSEERISRSVLAFQTGTGGAYIPVTAEGSDGTEADESPVPVSSSSARGSGSHSVRSNSANETARTGRSVAKAGGADVPADESSGTG